MLRMNCFILLLLVVIHVSIPWRRLVSEALDESDASSSSDQRSEENDHEKSPIREAGLASSTFEFGETSDPMPQPLATLMQQEREHDGGAERYETPSASFHDGEIDHSEDGHHNGLVEHFGFIDFSVINQYHQSQHEVQRFISSSMDGMRPAKGESIARARFEVFDKMAPERKARKVYDLLNYLKKALELGGRDPTTILKRSKIINLIELSFYKPESCLIDQLFDRKQLELAFDEGTNIRRFFTYHNEIQFEICYDHLKNLILTNIFDLPEQIANTLSDMRKDFKKYHEEIYFDHGIRDHVYSKGIVRFMARTRSIDEATHRAQIKQLVKKNSQGFDLSETEISLFTDQYNEVMEKVCNELNTISANVIVYIEQLRFMDQNTDLRKRMSRETASWLTSIRICDKFQQRELSPNQILVKARMI